MKRFSQVCGYSIEPIIGQTRYAFALSNMMDFQDLVELATRGGCTGNVLVFYDLSSGAVFAPFEPEKNVVYRAPVYAAGAFYFLRGDYNHKTVSLVRYLPGQVAEVETILDLEAVNTYNLSIIGEDVYIVSVDERFDCYYPERFSFQLEENETPIFIRDGKVYLEAWVEEGWDEINHCAGENYCYYNRTVVRDFAGNKCADERGALFQAFDGTWWLG